MTALATDIAAKCVSAGFRALRAAKLLKLLWRFAQPAWSKERDELEANETKATASGGNTPFSIERRAVTLTFD